MTGMMHGKRGLIMGVANNHSIAWGIAKALAAQGAELAFTYQGEALGKRVKPLAAELGSDFLLECDVENLESALFGLLDRLLARHHQDRHAAKLRIGGGGDEVGRARTQGRHANAGLAGMAAIGGGHESRTLFVARQDQPDLGGARQAV